MVKVLEIKNLNYKDFQNINMSFNNNTFYTIIGDKKSGKTTLFKIIVGLINTNSNIKCHNISVKNRNSYIKNIGVVTTNFSFLFKTVLEEMRYPLENLNYSKRKINTRIEYSLKLLKIEYILYKRIDELNIYEKQKLLLCIALLHEPRVLLLDNILSIFSYSEQKEIINILKKQNICIINFTSNLNEAIYSDRIILLHHNKIIKEIMTNEMYDDDKIFYENNLELPFIMDLNIKFKMYNLIRKNYDNVKDMVNEIWQ